MRRNSTSAMGAIHPILFFTLVYGISLFMAIFVCRTVYNSLNEPSATNAISQPSNNFMAPGSTATALR